jgi:hypothetical protein
MLASGGRAGPGCALLFLPRPRPKISWSRSKPRARKVDITENRLLHHVVWVFVRSSGGPSSGDNRTVLLFGHALRHVTFCHKKR